MLKGKIAIVTGSSRGIGREIALRLARAGADIVINYANRQEEAGRLALEIERMGARALAIPADVGSFQEAKELVQRTLDEFGTVDILVNNAGITRDGLMMRMTEEDFDRVIEVNLKGTFNCTRHTVPVMVKQRSGRIINITSVAGLYGNPGQVNYAASKAAIIGLTKSLAKEIGSRGITVNAVAPGFTETEMTAEILKKNRDSFKDRIALRRVGKPKDVADAVYFLASDLGEYITGQVICVDGGLTI